MKLFKNLNSKAFVFSLVGAFFGTIVLSFVIFQLDLASSDNDIIRRYQREKIVSTSTIQTLIVGDSSAGNAIDAAYYTEISGSQTQNIALTGSFGLVGTYEMIDQALRLHPELENIIIIHTLDIWRRPFAKEGVFELRRGRNLAFWSEFFSRNPYIEYLEYASQIKNILRAGRVIATHTPLVRFIPASTQIISIDKEYDYLKQETSTYKNGGKILKGSEKLSNLVEEKNYAVFEKIDTWCKENKINCIFAHGPIHETVYQNSLAEILSINNAIRETQSLIILEDIFFYENDKIGDSINHIDVSIKREVTQQYYEKFKKYLK
jgi:hypothetical protein